MLCWGQELIGKLVAHLSKNQSNQVILVNISPHYGIPVKLQRSVRRYIITYIQYSIKLSHTDFALHPLNNSEPLYQ